MARYMIQATYNADARKALVAHPQDRVAGVAALMERMGGKLECFYFSMGEFDIVAIAELPDDISAAAGALAVTGAGHLSAYHTTKLLTNDEMMSAMNKAHGMTYASPSGD
ncbi:MAG TPA: GYD domain-containing protein [Nitrolancea sp.]|nr:GYD domain-containing protein [Nitrolancea sp.]